MLLHMKKWRFVDLFPVVLNHTPASHVHKQVCQHGPYCCADAVTWEQNTCEDPSRCINRDWWRPSLIVGECINQSGDIRSVIVWELVRWLDAFEMQTRLSFPPPVRVALKAEELLKRRWVDRCQHIQLILECIKLLCLMHCERKCLYVVMKLQACVWKEQVSGSLSVCVPVLSVCEIVRWQW